ncbi:MAG TPA: lysophospholipid acyltransferase family protein [Candidatus Cryosericum sp.]|nr:lysophospholipid acyltransferase family protein [Candidatus Cryosericum sp.]
MRPRVSFAQRAGYLAGRALLEALALLPTRSARSLGRRLGLLFFRLSARHRRVALQNIAAAFGDRLDAESRRTLARASFGHLGMIASDAPLFARHLKVPLAHVACVEGEEHLRAAAALGRGVLVFSGHYGHWELVALLQPLLGVPMTMVVSPMRNPWYDRYFARLRGLSGNTILSKRNAAPAILRALRGKRAVAILIDQNVRGDGGIFIDFFGRKASTTPALATLALRSGAPMVPVFSRFLPDGRLGISYRPAILPAPTGALEEDIRALTQACTSLLEEEIRRHPDCWLWMHDRWRTQPRGRAAGEADQVVGAGQQAGHIAGGREARA